MYGDSLMVQTADYFGFFLGLHNYVMQDHFAGGAAACDYLNDMRTSPLPDIAVISFSGNMLTPCTQNRGTQADVYTADYSEMAQFFIQHGVPVKFMSAPTPVGLTEADNLVARVEATVASTFHVGYYNAADVLTDENHVYRFYVACNQLEITAGDCFLGIVVIRADDMRHLRPTGARRWALRMVDATISPFFEYQDVGIGPDLSGPGAAISVNGADDAGPPGPTYPHGGGHRGQVGANS